MNKILRNIIKGLLVVFVLVLTAGVISLKMNMSPSTNMTLVSSSLINSIKTNEQVKEEKKEEIKEEKVEETKEEKQEEVKEEVKEEKQEEVKVEVKEEVKQEVKEEPVVAPTPAPEPAKPVETKPSVPEAQGSYNPNTEAVSGSSSSDTFEGYVTAYGPDCYGCVSGETASGYNVLNGNIYYNDPTYGTVRIVAADRSLKFGTIVKINGLNISSEPVIAIVLDRGGDIGFNKPKNIIFDLLYTSENSSEVRNFGKQYVTAEVLRVGY